MPLRQDQLDDQIKSFPPTIIFHRLERIVFHHARPNWTTLVFFCKASTSRSGWMGWKRWSSTVARPTSGNARPPANCQFRRHFL